MSIGRIAAIVLGATAVGAFVGLIIGWAMGVYSPDYYLSMFNAHDPVQFGIGAGISQGATMGFVFGCVVLILLAIQRRRD